MLPPLSRRLLLSALAAAPLSSGAPKPGMKILSSRPEDFEMPLDGFSTWITPIEKFFVRSHHYTPEVKLDQWKLTVGGKVDSPLTLDMAALRAMPKVELVGVLECAGNGRGLYEPSMPGMQWTYGSVGNARWTGVRLADVLRKANVQNEAIEVLFDGADVPVGTQPEFKRSIPIQKANDPNTLLAYEMNGQALPVSHGFPLRLVVPGWAGDSWVKWVTAIEVRDTEFDGFFMKTAYRHPGRPVAPGSTVDPAKMRPVTSLSVKSLITSHRPGAEVAPGPMRLRGVAWSNESPVEQVDVSTDGGRTWKDATLGNEKAAFGWRSWGYEFTPPGTAFYTVMARARNAAGETQPFVQEWNPSGYSHNAVHAVGIHVTENPKPPQPVQNAETLMDPPASFKQSCLACHTEEPIRQQRLTRTQWEREVEKMERWGARVAPETRSQLIDFLSSRFAARPGN